MSTLELFEFENFEGDSRSLQNNTSDLSAKGFDRKAQSLRVVGDPWVVFSELDYGYKGKFKIFREGTYPSIPSWVKEIRSAKIVRGGLFNPEITMFEQTGYNGKKVTLEKAATSLKHYDFDNMASSQKDVKGAWILYSEEYFKGDQMVTVAGENILNYHSRNWGNKVSSLKPFPPAHLNGAMA